MPRSYYDDNFGFYDMDGPEDHDFYHEVQRKSVLKKCAGCGHRVKLLPHYAYCNTCADKREKGWDF